MHGLKGAAQYNGGRLGTGHGWPGIAWILTPHNYKHIYMYSQCIVNVQYVYSMYIPWYHIWYDFGNLSKVLYSPLFAQAVRALS